LRLSLARATKKSLSSSRATGFTTSMEAPPAGVKVPTTPLKLSLSTLDPQPFDAAGHPAGVVVGIGQTTGGVDQHAIERDTPTGAHR
jgi:hypothetical protein